MENATIGYNCTMRFRLGCVLGFASGYYMGARAGRERYEELNQLLAKARRSDAYQTATDKAKDLVDDKVERAKDLVEDKVERARDFVEERRSGDGDGDGGGDRGQQGDGEEAPVGIPIGTIVGSELDPAVDDLSPGPPPAGSLSEDPRSGGPSAP
ncbi:MAG: hypothetical protein M3N37_00040 [Actinomycetota bacterium]|nr:hypothetical protein [Actinomycetota bacterium]